MIGIDDAIIGGAIGAAGKIIGGFIDSSGQRSANKTNLDIAREQMAFQERMSNTQWQRGVADMKAAGINPMLAVSQGGASAPTGASTTVQNENAGISRGFSSAAQAAQTMLTLKNLEAQTDKVKSDTDVNRANVRYIDANTRNVGAITDINRAKSQKESTLGQLWSIPNKMLQPVTPVIGDTGKVATKGFVNTAKSYLNYLNQLPSHAPDLLNKLSSSYERAKRNARARHSY